MTRAEVDRPRASPARSRPPRRVAGGRSPRFLPARRPPPRVPVPGAGRAHRARDGFRESTSPSPPPTPASCGVPARRMPVAPPGASSAGCSARCASTTRSRTDGDRPRPEECCSGLRRRSGSCALRPASVRAESPGHRHGRRTVRRGARRLRRRSPRQAKRNQSWIDWSRRAISSSTVRWVPVSRTSCTSPVRRVLTGTGTPHATPRRTTSPFR